MARHEFFPVHLGARLAKSLPWGVFLMVSAGVGVTLLLIGALQRGFKDAGAGALLVICSLPGLYQWYNLRRPLVVVEDDTLVWRSGLTTRRHSLADLALAPDPFDVTVLRLQTRGGKFLRVPRDGVAKAAELERLLQVRLELSAASGRATSRRDGESQGSGEDTDQTR